MVVVFLLLFVCYWCFLQGVHDLDNGVALLVAMGYKEEDCRRVLPTVENDVNRAVGVLLGEKEEDGGDGGGGKTSSATSATKTLEGKTGFFC